MANPTQSAPVHLGTAPIAATAVAPVPVDPSAGIGALVLLSAMWGSGYLAADLALTDGFGPLWLQSSRLVVAGGLLCLLAWRQGSPFPRRASVLATGTLAWTVGSGLQTVAQQTVPPGTTALIMGLGPAVAVSMSSAVEQRLPSRLEGAGLVLGLVGLTLLVGPSLGLSSGVLWLMLACLGWSGAAVWESKICCGAGALATAALQTCAGGIGLTILALSLGEPLPSVGTTGLAGWLWLTVICAALGLPLWLWLLRVLSVSTAMLQATLSPMIAAGLGWLLLGESWTLLGKLGMLGVLLGAGLTLRGAPQRS